MEENKMKVLLFELNEEQYATDILHVERILGYKVATEMPEVPSFVEGVIDYEDSILPVINLSKKFKLTSKQKNEKTKIIVVRREDKKFGIVVDNVAEVFEVSKDRFEEAPPITTQITQKYIKGLLKLEGKIVILLNMVNILTEEEEDIIF